jgi:hypothetical protein
MKVAKANNNELLLTELEKHVNIISNPEVKTEMEQRRAEKLKKRLEKEQLMQKRTQLNQLLEEEKINEEGDDSEDNQEGDDDDAEGDDDFEDDDDNEIEEESDKKGSKNVLFGDKGNSKRTKA